MLTIVSVFPANRLPTGCQQVTNCRPTVGRQLANTLASNITQTVGQLLANSRPTVGQQSLLGINLHYWQKTFSVKNVFGWFGCWTFSTRIKPGWNGWKSIGSSRCGFRGLLKAATCMTASEYQTLDVEQLKQIGLEAAVPSCSATNEDHFMRWTDESVKLFIVPGAWTEVCRC